MSESDGTKIKKKETKTNKITRRFRLLHSVLYDCLSVFLAFRVTSLIAV